MKARWAFMVAALLRGFRRGPYGIIPSACSFLFRSARNTVTVTCAMGHTRWATHGAPEERNAHPHASNDGSLAINNGLSARLILHACQLGTPHYVTETDVEFGNLDRNTAFHPFLPDVRDSRELELRYQMSLLIHRAYRQQLFTSTEGTFAARIEGGRFLITPRGLDRGNLRPEDLVLVDGFHYESGHAPSRAAWLFKKIFDTQPEVNSLILAHPPNLMGYAVSHEDFDPRVIPESYILLREMPAFPFGAQYRDPDSVARTISPRHPVIIIRNECVLSSGATLLQAFDRMEVAEYSAKATINARLLGGMKPITDSQIADLVKAFHLPE